MGRPPHPPPVDPLDVLCTGLGAGAGAGGVLGGARVGDGGGAAAGCVAAGDACVLAGDLWALCFLALRAGAWEWGQG